MPLRQGGMVGGAAQTKTARSPFGVLLTIPAEGFVSRDRQHAIATSTPSYTWKQTPCWMIIPSIEAGAAVGVSQTRKVASLRMWEIAVTVGESTPFRGNNGIGEMPRRRPSFPLVLGRSLWHRKPRRGAGKQHIWRKMLFGRRFWEKKSRIMCRGGFYISLRPATTPPQPLYIIGGSR